MCHQSVGLAQNALESAGIACASVTLKPEITDGVKVSRAAWVRFPLGRPLGPAGQPGLQRAITEDVLGLITAFPELTGQAAESGAIVRLPYRWRRS